MQKTGIPVRSIARVDTLMALDAVRRASLEDASLDEVAQAIRWSQGFPTQSRSRAGEGLKPALITVCLTGGQCQAIEGISGEQRAQRHDDIAILRSGF